MPCIDLYCLTIKQRHKFTVAARPPANAELDLSVFCDEGLIHDEHLGFPPIDPASRVCTRFGRCFRRPGGPSGARSRPQHRTATIDLRGQRMPGSFERLLFAGGAGNSAPWGVL